MPTPFKFFIKYCGDRIAELENQLVKSKETK